MARQYSIAEARASLTEIIDQVESGDAIELTRRGRPVAVVVSRRAFDHWQAGRGQFGDAYQRFLGRFSLDEVGLEPDELASIRDRTPGRRVRL